MTSTCLLMNPMLVGLPISHMPVHSRTPSLTTRANFLGARCSSTRICGTKPVKTDFVTGGNQSKLLPVISSLPRWHTCAPPRASNDVPYSFHYPPTAKKPRWWWRTLSSLHYLIPLHQTWAFSNIVYQAHPSLEDLEFLVQPFFRVRGPLPVWFPFVYLIVGYLLVVRRKEWPHFFRFHMVMSILLEMALQALLTVSRMMPLGLKWGKLGMHFWTAVAFAYFLAVLECMRCALAGKYANVPYATEAAYIQISYE